MNDTNAAGPDGTTAAGQMPSFAAAFRVWLKIGLLSFGGPAGQIALLHKEVVAAVQSLGQSTSDYAAAVADYNRAQFRLYRLGHPAFALCEAVPQYELPAVPAALQPKP